MNIGTRIFTKSGVFSIAETDIGVFVMTEDDMAYVDAGRADGMSDAEIFEGHHKFETYEDAMACVAS